MILGRDYLRHRHPDELSDAGNAGSVHCENEVVAWDHDSGVGGEGQGIGVSVRGAGEEGNAALVRVDGMRGSSDSDNGK